MKYLVLYADGHGPQSALSDDVAIALLKEFFSNNAWSIAECFLAMFLEPDSDKARLMREGCDYMRTCLYGEFSEYDGFSVGFFEAEDADSEDDELFAVDVPPEQFAVLTNEIIYAF